MEISKEHGDENLIDFGEEVLNKACFLFIMRHFWVKLL